MKRPLATTLTAILCFVPPRPCAADSYAIRVESPPSLSTRPLLDEKEVVEKDISAGDVLTFAYSIPKEVYQQETGTYTFSVVARVGGRERKLLKEKISPATRAGDAGWRPVRIPLDKLSGKHATFQFSAVSSLGNKSLLKGPIIGGLRIGNFRRRPGEYNIILISIDTLRWDRLGISGYDRDTSPDIDELARHGVYFRQTVAQSSWTKPSHMSLFTSLYPSIHGMEAHFGQPGVGRRLAQRFPTLTEVLSAHGFVTQAFTGSGHVTAAVGFDRGFDEFREFSRPDGPFVFSAGEDWIKAHAEEKFFLFLHTYEVHSPRRHNLFVKTGMRKRARMDAAYDSGVNFVSELVGELVTTLQKTGLRENTMIVIFSDHGDSLGDHGLMGHGNSLYDELVLVPLIFNLPNVLSPRRVLDFTPQLIDVFPTLCDLAGVPVPSGVMGRSLKPILMGGDTPRQFFGLSELTRNVPIGKRKRLRPQGRIVSETDEVPVQIDERLTSVRYHGAGDFKLISCQGFAEGWDKGLYLGSSEVAWQLSLAGGGRQLFDLNKDPDEFTNIGPESPDVIHQLQQLFQNEMSKGPAPRGDADVEKEKPLDPGVAEELRTLGY